MQKTMWTAGFAGALLIGAAACGGGAPAPGASSAPAAAPAAPAAAPAALAAVPAPYAGMKSPLAEGDQAAIDAGKKIFAENCATCHGETGHGDGPAAAALDPKARNLTEPGYISALGDDRLMWRISEGGPSGPPNSAMPPWKDVLKEEQRWQVIAYVRSLAK